MRAALVCMLVHVCVGVRALEVETKLTQRCANGGRVQQTLALENHTLHEQIFFWAHNKDVGEWKYATGANASAELLARFDVSGAAAEALECVHVEYAATIRLPEPFETLVVMLGMQADIPLRVRKTVCAGSDVIFEEAHIDAPIVGSISMLAKEEVRDDVDLLSVAHTSLTLPWYAHVVSSQVSGALASSVLEKFNAVSRSLCDEDDGSRGKFAQLRALTRPLTPSATATANGSFALPAPARTAARKFPLKREHSAPETLALGRVGLRRVARSASAPAV